jgi:peptide/nickel transport system permease protein
MAAFIARRGLMAVLVLLGVVALVFVITRTFADPARLMLPIDASEKDYQQLRAQLHLNEPIPVQFGRFIGGVAVGDLGESFWQRLPVVDLVIQRLPATLMLAFASIILSVLISVPLGVAAAARPGSWVDRTIVSGSPGLLGRSHHRERLADRGLDR